MHNNKAQGIYNLMSPDLKVIEHSNEQSVAQWWARKYKHQFEWDGWEIWIALDGEFKDKMFFCFDEKKFRSYRLGLPTLGFAGVGVHQQDKRRVCYDCVAVRDKWVMDIEGRITLYLDGLLSIKIQGDRIIKRKTKSGVKITVSNWCGSLEYPVDILRVGNGGIAKVRRDVYFQDHNGDYWWGVNYGNNSPLVYCRRLKGKRNGSNKGTDRGDSENQQGDEDQGSEGRRVQQPKSKRLLVSTTTSV